MWTSHGNVTIVKALAIMLMSVGLKRNVFYALITITSLVALTQIKQISSRDAPIAKGNIQLAMGAALV